MGKIFAIPDIHGRADLLNALLKDLLLLLRQEDKIIFLGDMIDRGPDSKGVVSTILELEKTWPQNVIVLAGNHEWLAINATTRQDPKATTLWRMNGGDATQESFKLKCLPQDVSEWMMGLPLSYEEDEFFFSHAPLPIEEERQPRNRGKEFTMEELTWTYHREEERFARFEPGKIGVCGHVHGLPQSNFRPRFYPHYIFADAGCGCHPDAPLVAIEVRSREVFST